MFSKYYLVSLILIGSLASACGIEQTTVTRVESPLPVTSPTSTQTSLPPTETPIPLAVIINGEGITLDEFNAELDRYLSSQGGEADIERQSAETLVLDDLIGQTLLSQGAQENGFELTDEILSERIQNLINDAGGEAAFNQWLQANGYHQESFRRDLEKSIKAAWMRDQILTEVPSVAKQVNLRQIFLLDADQADQVYQELESGTDFATLAEEYDPLTRGEIGWVPRNYLPHKIIEEAAFALQPGEYSPVLETTVGYHIIQVIAIEDERRLSPDARLIWQELALRDWVNQRREESNIEILALG
jgi:peptidyl-prolyl cis-trans isomerase C